MTLDKTPRYHIKAVSKKTGLTTHTVRAWERRYGVPSPPRTDGGYRLYSDADVRRLETMMKLIAEGTAHAQAAEIVKRADVTDEG